MTYKNLPDKNDAFNDVDQTSGKAKRNSGLTPEACQTIFEFMAKAKANELARQRLIQYVVYIWITPRTHPKQNAYTCHL